MKIAHTKTHSYHTPALESTLITPSNAEGGKEWQGAKHFISFGIQFMTGSIEKAKMNERLVCVITFFNLFIRIRGLRGLTKWRLKLAVACVGMGIESIIVEMENDQNHLCPCPIPIGTHNFNSEISELFPLMQPPLMYDMMRRRIDTNTWQSTHEANE